MTGIVLTGGGSQLRNLPQLFSYITGKEARIGLPNEHLGKDSKDLIKSPIYATGVGLVQKGFEDVDWKNVVGVPILDGNELPEEPPITQKSKSGIGGKLKEMLENWFSDDEIN